MPDIITSVLGDAFSYLTQRASQNAAAQAYVKSVASAAIASPGFDVTTSGSNKQKVAPENGTHRISLELLNYPLPPTTNQSPQGTQSNPGGTVIATLDFDVVLTQNGLAQQMTQQHVARQVIHQTLSGFYVDQFGMGAGHLSIEADVIFYSSDPTTQILAFKQALIMAKNQSPLNLQQPPVLYLHDIFTGQTLQITQTMLEIHQSAEKLNYGTVKIEADILMDYSSNLSSQTNASRVTSSGSPTTGLQQSLYGPSGSGFPVPVITNTVKSLT